MVVRVVCVSLVLCVCICSGCPSFILIPPWRFVFYAMDADDVTVCVKGHPLGRVAARRRGGRRERRDERGCVRKAS
jgi:hypothetical protein